MRPRPELAGSGCAPGSGSGPAPAAASADPPARRHARSRRQPAVADELEELGRRVEGPSRWLSHESVPTDRQDVPVGRLEGDLLEPGVGEVRPGRRAWRPAGAGAGSRSPADPDRQNPGSAWMVRVRSLRLMFPKTPQTSTRSAGTASSYQRHRDASPSTTRTWSATPAAAARSRAKDASAGSARPGAPRRRHPLDGSTRRRSRHAPARRTGSPPGWALDGQGARHRGRRAPWPGPAATAGTTATRGPRRTRASAPSANPSPRRGGAGPEPAPPRCPPLPLDGPRGP